MDEDIFGLVILGLGLVAFILFIAGLVMVNQMVKPWWAELDGKAELAQAEQNRQIAILEAKAKMESAELLAQAEVKRAEGVAQANKIIGDSLKENEDYLRYLWITDVAGANIDKTVVYIPTEANLPIMEAGRMQNFESRKK